MHLDTIFNCLTLEPGSLLAVLTAGAYGMVMASNYNQRTRPPEVVVAEDGKSWRLARRRETWEDLTATRNHLETSEAMTSENSIPMNWFVLI